MQEFDFYTAQTVEQACRMLAEPGSRLVAGGTDVIPQMLNGRLRAGRIIDISRLAGLKQVELHGEMVHIGALVTYAELIASPLLQAEAPLLVQAAAVVGCVQTRYRGTLGGNIANASPAGDSLPPLLALQASVTLVSAAGERTLPLEQVLQGPGITALAPAEMIHHVVFARLSPTAKSIFLRLGSRQGMAVAVASAALVLELEPAGQVSDVRLALGAVAPTPMRCREAEGLLVGKVLKEENIERFARTAAEACSPIDDVRGTADYRRHAVKVLARRGLRSLAGIGTAAGARV